MIAKFQHHINRNEPIQFMLPAFPFKVRNPLKSSRTAADLAEVASFCKINEINLQICKVYGPGAEFHIFHDGHLYYRHFLNTKEDADVYFQSLKEYTNALQLEKVIILKDVSRELLKFKNFPEVCKDARKEMKNLWDAEKDSNERVLAIRRASCSNVNLSDISEDVLHEISVSPSNNLSERSKLISVEITRRADRCAFEYMIIQHSLERLSFFTSSLPNGVRMTVHPKEGQVGIFLVKRTTFLLPWMGVGVMKKNGEMSVRYECEVKHNKQFTSVFVGADTSPFYYLEN
jgi:pyoverdine/dityrosine biosynthesis protein Dit1